MRGSTIKKISKFVDILIKNTPPEEQIKSRPEMINEVKLFWKDKKAQKFVNDIVSDYIGD